MLFAALFASICSPIAASPIFAKFATRTAGNPPFLAAAASMIASSVDALKNSITNVLEVRFATVSATRPPTKVADLATTTSFTACPAKPPAIGPKFAFESLLFHIAVSSFIASIFCFAFSPTGMATASPLLSVIWTADLMLSDTALIGSFAIKSDVKVEAAVKL